MLMSADEVKGRPSRIIKPVHPERKIVILDVIMGKYSVSLYKPLVFNNLLWETRRWYLKNQNILCIFVLQHVVKVRFCFLWIEPYLERLGGYIQIFMWMGPLYLNVTYLYFLKLYNELLVKILDTLRCKEIGNNSVQRPLL